MRTPLDNWYSYKRTFGFKQRYPDSFGTLAGRPHLGLDILCPNGTPIYAPVDGQVQKMVRDQGGKTIHLNAGLLKFRFLHLSEFGKGGDVKEGDLIGYTGNTGLSTAPHLHYDISRDKLYLDDIENFIDPDLFHKEIKVAVLTPKEYDLSNVISDFRYLGINLVIHQKKLDSEVQWYQRNSVLSEVDNRYFDSVIHMASGYDIVAIICDNYEPKNNGYAKRTQRHGLWRCFINNTGKPREYHNSHWNGKNQVAGTLAHELLHILDSATGDKYGVRKIHEYDEKGVALNVRFDMDKFQGWKVPGKTRLFKWHQYRTMELINGKYQSVVKKGKKIKSIIIPTTSSYLYRLAYSKDIPKP